MFTHNLVDLAKLYGSIVVCATDEADSLQEECTWK